eukprot:CAMPEP_0194085098 /NCGR_PEP_ID=MMETSP0149-20130528/16221_1 /TAXON_ID=122233 /ORGANISM="Chaetoceros debilis, Strain MM31A-1" /LENGTH=1447 /DNA_ID=CAMNT_0038767901 /DNA_START=51 /DNA_END=4394 /DNA_ORIENTATION=+
MAVINPYLKTKRPSVSPKAQPRISGASASGARARGVTDITGSGSFQQGIEATAHRVSNGRRGATSSIRAASSIGTNNLTQQRNLGGSSPSSITVRNKKAAVTPSPRPKPNIPNVQQIETKNGSGRPTSKQYQCAESNSKSASMSISQISSSSKTKSSMNLKTQLRREIIMLKRQKMERKLAKKRQKEQLIQQQVIQQRELLRQKELEEKRKRQELLLKNRERKIQEKKERLMNSLSISQTLKKNGSNGGSGKASAGSIGNDTAMKCRLNGTSILKSHGARDSGSIPLKQQILLSDDTNDQNSRVNIDVKREQKSVSGDALQNSTPQKKVTSSHDCITPRCAATSAGSQGESIIENTNNSGCSKLSNIKTSASGQRDKKAVSSSHLVISQPPTKLTTSLKTDKIMFPDQVQEQHLRKYEQEKFTYRSNMPAKETYVATTGATIHGHVGNNYQCSSNPYYAHSAVGSNSQVMGSIDMPTMYQYPQQITSHPYSNVNGLFHAPPFPSMNRQFYPSSLPIFQQYPYSYQNHPPLSVHSASMLPLQRKRQTYIKKTKTTSAADMILHKDPLSSQSPFAKTHETMPCNIVIWKKKGGREFASFGVELRYQKKGTLVEIEKANTNSKVELMPNGRTSLSEKASKSELEKPADSYAMGNDSSAQVEVTTYSLPATVSSTSSESKISSQTYFDEGPSTCIGDGRLILDNNKHSAVKGMDISTDNQATAAVRNSEIGNGVSYLTSRVNSSEPLLSSLNSDQMSTLSKVAKPKKKRVSYGALIVKTAAKQNDRANAKTRQEEMLQSGDIILKINGQAVTGMNFLEATSLFGKSNVKGNQEKVPESDKIVECNLTVARERRVKKILNKLAVLADPPTNIKQKNSKKPSASTNAQLESSGVFGTKLVDQSPAKSLSPFSTTMPPTVPAKNPFVTDELTGVIRFGEFSSSELNALVSGMIERRGENEDTAFADILTNPKNPKYQKSLLQRTSIDLKRKWYHSCNMIDKQISKRALDSWKEEWEKETHSETVAANTSAVIIPSQRSNMRSAPRPIKGCKCGQLDHSRVYHDNCFLYRNLKQLSDSESTLADGTTGNKLSFSKLAKYEGKLNSIGNAQMQRMKKYKEEQESDEKEAIFVNAMEILQISKLKVAVFAPRQLSVLVLSAVATFMEQNRHLIDIRPHVDEGKSNDGDESESDDESIPLLALKKEKRSLNGSPFKSNKRQRRMDNIANSFCVAKVLQHISLTWGHLFEFDQLESLWVDHCYQNGFMDSEVAGIDDSLQRNSRDANLPFEGLQYSLVSNIINRLQDKATTSRRCVDDHTTIINGDIQDEMLIEYLSSDKKTGLFKEIKSLISHGLIDVTQNGYLTLSKNWELKVPPFILDDMGQGWTERLDRENKFCIHPEIRSALSKSWRTTSQGWICVDGGPDELDDEFYNARKQSFLGKVNDRMNENFGIAQFGI